MGPSFVVYIDESGDEGFSFHKGSSEWFILSAVITPKERDIETVKLVDTVRMQLGRPDKKPLHFRKLRHEHRVPYVSQIAKANLRCISVLVHKPSINAPETFQKRYRLYFYFTRYLLERVSWICRDQRKHNVGDGTAEIVFSNRSGMSYDELKDYFSRLKSWTGIYAVQIDWSVINEDKIMAYTAGSRMGLQIADAVASSFYYAVEPSQYGYMEEKYAQLLKPVVYHRRGRYLGYGLKFWPWNEDEVVKHFEWVQKHYK
ncbi:MAG: hypothetical protein A3C38_00965 [Planctomycetes bacterium RIFCSPHIGHO2_02_FULL_50_42]|nr:MAG: hypothetical protein A3C38_00965 [Planctomycetes bacterium RIFCSPHIGHO2_02_FULL_50_42]OHB92132.1 MAG: hypothetical protein A3E75_03465 [Planctomycetes bacterium RIFCSPHIGHO2_12_FULL_51_37]